MDAKLRSTEPTNAALALQALQRLSRMTDLCTEQYQALFRALRVCIEHGDPQAEFLAALRTMSGADRSMAASSGQGPEANHCVDHVSRLMRAFNACEAGSAKAREVCASSAARALACRMEQQRTCPAMNTPACVDWTQCYPVQPPPWPCMVGFGIDPCMHAWAPLPFYTAADSAAPLRHQGLPARACMRAQVFGSMLLPFLTCLAHERVREALHGRLVNPLLACVASKLQLDRLARLYEAFAGGMPKASLGVRVGVGAAAGSLHPAICTSACTSH